MSDCGKCRYKKSDKRLVGCEGSCQKWFHFSCIGLTENDFVFVERNTNIFYLCDDCKRSCKVVDTKSIDDIKNDV